MGSGYRNNDKKARTRGDFRTHFTLVNMPVSISNR